MQSCVGDEGSRSHWVGVQPQETVRASFDVSAFPCKQEIHREEEGNKCVRVRRLAPCHVLSRTNPVGSSREQPRWKIASDPEKPSSTTVSLLCPSHSNYLRTCGVVVGLVLQADLTAGRLVWQHVLRRRLRHAPCLALLCSSERTLHHVPTGHYSAN